MIIKGTKEVGLIEFEAILELEKYSTRMDIAKFLKEKLNSNDELDLKVKKNFLLPLELIDKEHNLTSKGKECIDTGKVWLKEKGEYTFTEINDSLFNAIINVDPFGIKNKKDKINTKNIKKQEITSIKNMNNKYRIIKDVNVFYEFRNTSKKVNLTFIKDLKGDSNFYIEDINYEMEKPRIDINFKVNIDSNTILESIDKTGDLKWNKEVSAFEVTHSFAKENNESNYNIKDLSLDLRSLDINCFGFDKIFLENINIMPNNPNEAYKWYFDKITSILKHDYIKEIDFNIKNDKEINSKYIKYYNINKLEIPEILREIKNQDEFWNLKTPLDLTLNI